MTTAASKDNTSNTSKEDKKRKYLGTDAPIVKPGRNPYIVEAEEVESKYEGKKSTAGKKGTASKTTSKGTGTKTGKGSKGRGQPDPNRTVGSLNWEGGRIVIKQAKGLRGRRTSFNVNDDLWRQFKRMLHWERKRGIVDGMEEILIETLEKRLRARDGKFYEPTPEEGEGGPKFRPGRKPSF